MSQIEKETEKEKSEEKERKIYKGEVKTVAQLLEGRGPIMVQPMERDLPYPYNQKQYRLPPTFAITKFVPASNGKHFMHYVVPGDNPMKMYREVSQDFPLNVLSGRRKAELDEAWKKVKEKNLLALTRRMSATMGADPEIFAVDSDGGVIPAWTFLGSKSAPTKYYGADDYNKGETYWDGFQAEFTTPPGVACLVRLGESMYAGLNQIYTSLRKTHPKAKLSLASVLPVLPEVLEAEEKQNPDHVAFGCAPSHNLYGLKGNLKEGRDVPWRFAGGHIHFGEYSLAGGKRTEQIHNLVRGLDQVLAVACVSMFAKYDNPMRREYYGQPGEFRTPKHGLEYRVLSNAWLCHPLIYNMVFDLARSAAGLANEGLLDAWDTTETETVETIMNHEVDRARAILKRNENTFKAVLQSQGGSYYSTGVEAAWRVWTTGLDEAIKNPEDIVGNWGLGSGYREGGFYKHINALANKKKV